MIEKFVSLALAGTYLMAAYLFSDAGAILVVAAGAIAPLTLIWFAEEMGSFLGATGVGWLRSETPALWVKRLGWALLILFPPAALVLL